MVGFYFSYIALWHIKLNSNISGAKMLRHIRDVLNKDVCPYHSKTGLTLPDLLELPFDH